MGFPFSGHQVTVPWAGPYQSVINQGRLGPALWKAHVGHKAETALPPCNLGSGWGDGSDVPESYPEGRGTNGIALLLHSRRQAGWGLYMRHLIDTS